AHAAWRVPFNGGVVEINLAVAMDTTASSLIRRIAAESSVVHQHSANGRRGTSPNIETTAFASGAVAVKRGGTDTHCRIETCDSAACCSLILVEDRLCDGDAAIGIAGIESAT